MMMEEEEETNVEPLSSLLELPAEVQAHIYSFLSSLPILLSLASVCKALNRLVSEELPWLLNEISFHRCANRMDDALMEQMLRHNLYAKTPFRPRHLNLSGCHNISLDMLNRLTTNGERLRTLKLAGCFHLFANPHATTERTRMVPDTHFDFVQRTERDSDDEYDDAQLDINISSNEDEEPEGDRSRARELANLRDHRLKLRELTLRLHTITTLDLAGCYTLGAAVYLEKILAASVNVIDLNISGWTLRMTLGLLLSQCGKLQRLNVANVRPNIDEDNLKGLSVACPLIRFLDLSGTRAPRVKSFGRLFAFLERVVLARVSTVVEHDEWANGQEDCDRLIVRSEPAGLSDSHSPHGNRRLRVVQHTFDVSSPDALRASLAKAEASGVVDINGMLLIEQKRIKLSYPFVDVEVKKKGVIGTLLTQAIYLAEPDMVEAILEHGANPNLSNAGDGQSPLYIATRFFKRLARVIRGIRTRLPPEWPKLLSVRDKMRAIIDLLLAHNASAAPIPNEPDSCFSEAVLSDDIDLVKRLLTVGRLHVEELFKPNVRIGCTILHRVLIRIQYFFWKRSESLKIAAFLVELGADPFVSEGVNEQNGNLANGYIPRAQRIRSNYTAWDRALKYGDARLVETIVHRFNPDLTAIDRTIVWKGSEMKVSALQYAVFHRNDKVVRLLLTLGAADGATARLRKVYKKKRFTWHCDNFTDVAHRQTLADNGHNQENYPHVAVVSHLWPLGSERVVDIFKVAKGTKDTYLHSHIADININVLALVLENGVEPNLKNANGDTAGHIVMRKGVRRHWRRDGSWFIAEGLTPYDREKLRMLSVYGADLNAANDAKGATLLHMAVNNNDVDTVALLLDCDVAPDPLDADGLTPLQLAVSNRRVELVQLLVTCGRGADANQRVSAAMARFIAKRCAEQAKEEAEWSARRAEGKRGKRKRCYDDDVRATDGLVVPFGHFLRHTPQKDMVLPATTTTTNTPTKAKAKTKKKKKQQRSESEDGDDSEGEVVPKEQKRKRITVGKGKGKRAKKRSKKTTMDEKEEDHADADKADHDEEELIGSATMLHAVALIYGRCGESEQHHKECVVLVEALLGENLDRAVPTAAQRERFAKASKSRKKKTTTKKSIRAKQKKTKKTTKKSNETRGADPNLTDEQGNTALHAFAAMGLRQVVVALMLSGADVTARNDDGRLPLSLLPEYELVLLEKNAALLPATSATRHLLQSLLALHHHHEAA